MSIIDYDHSILTMLSSEIITNKKKPTIQKRAIQSIAYSSSNKHNVAVGEVKRDKCDMAVLQKIKKTRSIEKYCPICGHAGKYMIKYYNII